VTLGCASVRECTPKLRRQCPLRQRSKNTVESIDPIPAVRLVAMLVVAGVSLPRRPWLCREGLLAAFHTAVKSEGQADRGTRIGIASPSAAPWV